MKKIIATVLAMVMALALCTTAFAATPVVYTKAYDNKGNDISAERTFKVESMSAVKDTSAAGYKVTCVKEDGTDGDSWGYKVAATAADYEIKLTADGRAPLYLTTAPNAKLEYVAAGKVYTNVGDKCEQLDVADTSLTYYVVTDEDTDTNTYYVAQDDAGVNLLVDGKLVAVAKLTVNGKDQGLKVHTWKVASYDKDDKVATYKCKDCGVVATVYKTVEAAEAAGATMTDVTKDGNVIGWVSGKTTTDTKDNTSSPKTFDAGIAMYVGMALTSVAGSAVVIGKKKEF